MARKKTQSERADFALPDNTYDHVMKALKDKRWGTESKVLTHNEYLLFPTFIRKRKADGTFDEIPVCIRVPREGEMRKARAKAYEIMKEDGLDPERDADLFTNVETWCILAHAIRDKDEPFSPFDPDPRSLEQRYDKPSLMAIWAELDAYNRIIDPSPSQISTPEIMGLIVAIAREENTSPLVGYAQPAQSSCIVTMARLCVISMASKSLLGRLEVLKGEQSPPTP